MDIWIILNGEKAGPFRDFEIRRKIEDGELPTTCPAWHEGLEKWLPLGEIDLFKREFTLTPAATQLNKFPSEVSATPPPLKHHYLRRFWARWFDLSLFAGLWWLALWGAGRDISATMLNPWIMVLQFVPWFVLETVLLQHLGTTPGKWLLGLHVHNLNGSLLNLSESLRRSGRVLFTGIGFGWSLLAVFCQILSIITARRLGKPLWDYLGGHQVDVARLNPFRVVAFVLLFAGALYLQAIVTSPHTFELLSKQFPEYKQIYEKGPPWWHLPKRP